MRRLEKLVWAAAKTVAGVVAISALGACTSASTPGTSPGGATPSSRPSAPSNTPSAPSSAAPAATTPATTATSNPAATPKPASELRIEAFTVPSGSGAHDVAPARNGGVWYTAQASGKLGWLDPRTGEVREVPLGQGSRPHGVIVGADGAAWVTDGGLNAIVKVDEASLGVTVYRLPANRANANLNTAAFDGEGRLWFTGQAGIIGRLDPSTGTLEVFDAPRGAGPYGITGTPSGDVYFASLAGSYVGKIDRATGGVTVLEPPTARQGARRVWSDSRGRIWVSAWNTGQLAMYDPSSGAGNAWREWTLPGARPQAYAVYVDASDMVWVSDWGANALVRFDPTTERFDAFPLPHSPGNVRQILGRPGEVWAPESVADRIIVVR